MEQLLGAMCEHLNVGGRHQGTLAGRSSFLVGPAEPTEFKEAGDLTF